MKGSEGSCLGHWLAWERGKAEEEMSARSFERLPKVLSYQVTLISLLWATQTLELRGSSHLPSPEAGPGCPSPLGSTSEQLGVFKPRDKMRREACAHS